MKHFVVFIFLSVLLTSCGLAPTAKPTATLTFIPTATKIPTATVTPTETPIFIAPIWQKSLGTNYQIGNDGKVLDKITGKSIPELTYISVNEQIGEMQMEYEFGGNPNFKMILEPKDVKIADNGKLDFPGWLWNGEKMVRQKYTVLDQKGINVEDGDFLYNIPEMQAFLANPKNVDLSKRDFLHRDYFGAGSNTLTVERGTIYDLGLYVVNIRGIGGKKSWVWRWGGRGHFLNTRVWADNVIPTPNGNNGWNVVETTTFLVSELNNTDPITIIAYTGNDGEVHAMLGDTGDLVPNEDDPRERSSWASIWSLYYITHNIAWYNW